MGVPEDMQLRAYPHHRIQKLLTACVQTGNRISIEDAEGRPMADQDVGVPGNLSVKPFPVLCRTHAKRATVRWSDRRAPEPQSLDLDAFVDQYSGIAKQGATRWIGLQKEFVVSRHDDFVPVWHFAKPMIEVGHFLYALGEQGEIASVDQDVAIRHVDFAMKLVRVTEEDKAECGTLYRG